MKIDKVRIVNFRSFADETVEFGNYTSLIGANGAGKSTVLCALNIFFRELEGATTNLSELDRQDFHNENTEKPIEITVTFRDLDADAQASFKDYFRNGTLVVTAKAFFDNATQTASVKQFGQRLVMQDFAPYFALHNDGATAADLKAEYTRLLNNGHPHLPPFTTKVASTEVLRAYEEAHPELCTLIPSPDQFYGFSKGVNRLDKFVQWVYVPAVKDATKENIEAKNTALGRLLSRTVRSKVKFDADLKALREDALQRYDALLAAQQDALKELSGSLTKRLSEWAHPDATAVLAWAGDSKGAIRVEEPAARLVAGDGVFSGELARFGHGLQRSYLLALLQELAQDSLVTGGPTLLLACEEPELYQHPPQARHLASVLQKLSDSDAQVVVSTHSPYFVTGRTFESVRYARRDKAARKSHVRQAIYASITRRYAEVTGEAEVPVAASVAQLHQVLQPQLNEMFFASHVALAEGPEDVAYIHAWMMLTGRWEEYRRSGCHVLACYGKSELIRPLILAQELHMPAFVIFDADGGEANQQKRAVHERDNKAILRLMGGDETKPFPDETVWTDAFVQWPENIGANLKTEAGQAAWDVAYGRATKGLGNPDGKFGKNTVHIGDHLRYLHEGGTALPSLDLLCDAILAFGNASQ